MRHSFYNFSPLWLHEEILSILRHCTAQGSLDKSLSWSQNSYSFKVCHWLLSPCRTPHPVPGKALESRRAWFAPTSSLSQGAGCLIPQWRMAGEDKKFLGPKRRKRDGQSLVLGELRRQEIIIGFKGLGKPLRFQFGSLKAVFQGKRSCLSQQFREFFGGGKGR